MCVFFVSLFCSVLQVDRAMEEERDRRINNDKAEFDEKKEAREKLITVQEDLLKTLRKMKASLFLPQWILWRFIGWLI